MPIWTKKPTTRSTTSTSACGVEAGGDDLDQRDGQEDGDGIVGAGFDFQRRAHPVAQVHVAGAQQEENRRRVGGGDGGAEQERFQPGEIGQVESDRAEQAGGQHDADRGERNSGQCGLPQRRDRRAEAGIEKDDGKRQRADEIGDPRIVELDAETIDAGGQSEAEKQQQQRSAEAEGDQARKRGGQHKRRAHQRHEINRLIHAGVAPPSALRALPYSAAKARRGARNSRD